MPENCNPNECPVNARVDRMEKELDRYRENSGRTHPWKRRSVWKRI